MNKTKDLLKELLLNPPAFAEHLSGVKLRAYQVPVIERVVDSILNGYGDTICVMFPRQSGKNETQAQLEAYLLTRFMLKPLTIVKFSPTFKPQSINSMQRLDTTLDQNAATAPTWRKEAGYMRRMGQCRIAFFSAEKTANKVGPTANLLLEVDEAQHVDAQIFDTEIDPMRASTNATAVFYGTAWTSDTLLAREINAAKLKEQEDGRQRVFIVTADQVSAEVPAYRQFVQEKIRKLGRNHPSVKTQYFCETIDAEASMFPPGRQLLMTGGHEPRTQPEPGKTYAFTVDVGGEITDPLAESQHDSTVLTIFEIDGQSIPEVGKPTYKTMCRYTWTGDKHTTTFQAIRKATETWKPRYAVIDATGVGEGLYSLLNASRPNLWIPVKFSQSEKSDIGYEFLAIIETGRFCEYSPFPDDFKIQLDHCRAEYLPNVQNTMRWGVPDGTRQNGIPVHDDLVLSAALVSILDRLEWYTQSPTVVIRQPDPLSEMDRMR